MIQMNLYIMINYKYEDESERGTRKKSANENAIKSGNNLRRKKDNTKVV